MPPGRSSKELIRAQELAEGVNISERNKILAAELVKGTNQTQACLKAGYPKSTAKHQSRKIINGKGVRAALIQIAESLSNHDIGQMSKGKLVQIIEDPEIEPRTIIQALRMGLELDGQVGPAKELIMRHEIHVPPAAQEMIARRIFELQKNSEAIDATAEGHTLSLQEGN
jgi:hypothetical protein